MLSLRRISPVILLTLLILRPVSLSAAWPLDGAPIFTVPNEHIQGTSVIIDDGEGGAIIVWHDERNGNRDIFAQRVDHQGNIIWSVDGVVVCDMTGSQSGACAVSDGAGGAIIAWHDYRGGVGDIYAQRIDADGNRLWLLSGSAICTAANDQTKPVITTDGAGGAIIAWYDDRSGVSGDNDIYVRHVDSDGNVYWTIWGVPVCTDASSQTGLQIASNGYGGAYMAWYDSRNGNNDIFCELVYSNGSLAGGAGGVWSLHEYAASQYYPRIIELAPGDVLISWQDGRNGGAELFAQRLVDIMYIWTYNGIQVATTVSGYELRAVKDKDGCVVFCWKSFRNGAYGIFAQRLLMTGIPLWPMDGVTVCDIAGEEQNPAIVSDATGGTIIVFDHSNGLQISARAQRLDGDGNQLWDPDGVRICNQPHAQFECIAVPDGKGGAITAWSDLRAVYTHIYAQRIDRHGYSGSPEPVIESASDVPMDQGGKVELTWDASYLDPWPNQEITYYSIWKSLSPASAMMLNEIEYTDLQNISHDEKSAPGIPSGMVIRRETVGAATYYWELLETQPAQYYDGYSRVLDTDFTSLETAFTYSYYQVAAHTSDPLVVWTSQPDSGYSLDNLAPAAPVGLEGEQEYSPEGMDLVWNSNTEEDLSHYVIYRGIYPTFAPDASAYLTSAYDTMFFDGGWTWEPGFVYKVSAVDIHDNESGYALLLPGQVTGDDPPTPAHSDYLSQNWPNPFNPSTTIQFGLEESGHVRLSIYAASGRLVSELVNSTLPAGNYSEIWNGTNSSGAYVASGIYFYRLDAGGFSMKKKMVLLR